MPPANWRGQSGDVGLFAGLGHPAFVANLRGQRWHSRRRMGRGKTGGARPAPAGSPSSLPEDDACYSACIPVCGVFAILISAFRRLAVLLAGTSQNHPEWSAAGYHRLFLQERDELRIVEQPHELGVEPAHDGGRRALRRRQSPPALPGIVQPGFREGRHVRAAAASACRRTPPAPSPCRPRSAPRKLPTPKRVICTFVGGQRLRRRPAAADRARRRSWCPIGCSATSGTGPGTSRRPSVAKFSPSGLLCASDLSSATEFTFSALEANTPSVRKNSRVIGTKSSSAS